MVFIFLFLISLHTIISKSIHVAANGIIYSFLWLNSIPLYTCTTSSLSFPVVVDGHLDCFLVLAIMNSA